MLEKYYPITESFLLGKVEEKDLYGYITSGFALLPYKGKMGYVSYCFTKPMLFIPQTQESDDIFQKRKKDESNISLLIKLLAKFKHIQIHYGDCQESWDMIKKELTKEEYKDTVVNFEVLIRTVFGYMFPSFIQ